MFVIDKIFQTTDQLTLVLILEIMGAGLLCGILFALMYLFVNRAEGCSKGFATTMILLPMTMAVIVLVLNGNNSWATGLSVAGIFSVIRFRTTHNDPKDLSLVLGALGAGVACGTGLILAGILVTVVICAVMIVLNLISFGTPRVPKMNLKITIPESLNYVGVFDEVFGKYANNWRLEKVKSSNFGTMFELTFQISFKKGINQKEFLDDLRTINGNLNIMLQNYVYDAD